MKRSSSISISISPTSAIWLAVLVLFSEPSQLAALLVAVSLHELGHIAVARGLGIGISRFHLSVLGARLEVAREIPYLSELLLAAGGPLSGLLLALGARIVSATFVGALGVWLADLSTVSLCLSIFNLLPLPTLDGGRIYFCLLCSLFSLRAARLITRVLALLCLLSLWLLSVYLLLRAEFGLSMLIFSCIFFARCFIFDNRNGGFMSF